jgi:polysaccharide export outer membrane protein
MKHLFRGSLLICLLAGACLAQSAAQSNAGEGPASPSTASPAAPAPAPPAQNSSAAGPTGPAPVPAPIPQNPPKPKSGAKAPEPSGAPGAAKAASAPYVIGSLDVLQIKVWNNANLTGLVDVRPDGMISLQLIGEVKADGLTVAELREQLKAKLNQFLTDPEVDVDVAKINSKRYYILGEGVLRAGAYPLTEPVTIMEALSNAGGFQAFANLKKIYLMRGSQKFPFNYKDVSRGKHLDQDIQVQNGDRIYVPQ